jgi:hypothetical protein
MRLFGRRTAANGAGREAAPSGVEAAAQALGGLLETRVVDAEGRIRVEDLLTAGAAVCGEACIAAAGEFDPESHNFVPGSAVLSDRINELLAANASDWSKAGDSVFGLIHAGALARGYTTADFPQLANIFRVYVSLLGGGEADRWGFVGLSVAQENWPQVPPLRYAYELRAPAREILARYGVPRAAWPAACAEALANELGVVHDSIDPGVAIRIVLETTNGMAKMAPMTDRHFHEASESTDSSPT